MDNNTTAGTEGNRDRDMTPEDELHITVPSAEDIVGALFDRLKAETPLHELIEAGRLVPNSTAMVALAREAFGLPLPAAPVIPGDRAVTGCLASLHGSVAALSTSAPDVSVTSVAAALTRLQREVDHAFLLFGLGAAKPHLVNALQESEMSRLGDDGQPVRDALGKVIDGPNFAPPDIAGALALAYGEASDGDGNV